MRLHHAVYRQLPKLILRSYLTRSAAFLHLTEQAPAVTIKTISWRKEEASGALASGLSLFRSLSER